MTGWRSFAVFSDIHANICALEACLNDLENIRRQTGLEYPVFILGDVLDTGPAPRQTLEKVQEIAQVHIRGNHEDYLNECLSGLHRERYRGDLWRYVPWTLDQVGHAEFAAYFRKLLFSWESADKRLWFAHASREKNDAVPQFFSWAGAMSTDELFFEGECSRLCIVGHTHLSAIYVRPSGEVWINAGSVGYPFLGKVIQDRYVPYTCYVYGAYEISSNKIFVRIRRIPYRLDDVLKMYSSSGVLSDCEPYSRAIFAQTVLNESIVHLAFKQAREKALPNHQYADFLREYLNLNGVDAEIENIWNIGKQSAGDHP